MVGKNFASKNENKVCWFLPGMVHYIGFRVKEPKISHKFANLSFSSGIIYWHRQNVKCAFIATSCSLYKRDRNA